MIQKMGENWPDFRGPSGDSHSPSKDLPLEWSERKNVRWKTPLPGSGWSSPVVWGKQVWLTTADERGTEQRALCLDRETGKILKNLLVFANPTPQRITNDANGYASPSPVIEAGRVYVHFGTFGTACIDTKSFQILWMRRDLNCDHSVGPGSSPVLFEDKLILTFDGMDVQFLEGLDKKTGKTAWHTPRGTDLSDQGGEQKKAFSTPYLLTRKGKPEFVSTGARAFCGYDPRTGKELWRIPHRGYSNASRALAGQGLVFLNTGFNVPELWAARLDSLGGSTPAEIVWRYTRGMPTMSSPTLVEDLLYILSDSEFLTCLEATTGKEVWRERIGGRHYASPLYAAGRLYLFSDQGKTRVIQPGRTFTLLAESELESGCHASPAPVGRSLILRTRTHAYCLEERSASTNTRSSG